MKMITTRIFIILLGSALLIGSVGCFEIDFCQRATGKYIEDSLAVDGFHSINLATSGDVFISYGATQAVYVEGKSDAIDLLNTDVRDSVWVIDFEDCITNHDLDVHIIVPYVRALSVSGSGEIWGQDKFSLNDEMLLDVSGSGRIQLEIDAKRVRSRISGSGNIEIWGNTNKNILRISGSGEFEGFGLTSIHQDVAISGSGSAEIYVDGGDLDATITGSGSVYYKGNPSSVNLSVTGSGRVLDVN